MRTYICVCLLAAILACPAFLSAREAGWVPMPAGAWQPPPGSGVKSFKKSARPSPQKPAAGAPTVYDRQPPVTEAELGQFLILLPQFRQWTRQNNELAHPIVNTAGQPDFLYSQKAAQWVRSHGLEPMRFFCIMGRMAAGLAIIEEGNNLPETRPRDMPQVAQEEVALVRRHLGEILPLAAQPASR